MMESQKSSHNFSYVSIQPLLSDCDISFGDRTTSKIKQNIITCISFLSLTLWKAGLVMIQQEKDRLYWSCLSAGWALNAT